jgi:hypothetical protein
VCQVREAVCALVPWWWLEVAVPEAVLERTSERLQYRQRKNRASRESHRNRTLARYHAKGIRMSKTTRCHWPKQ